MASPSSNETLRTAGRPIHPSLGTNRRAHRFLPLRSNSHGAPLRPAGDAEAHLRGHEVSLVICAETLGTQSAVSFLSRVRALHPRSIRLICVDQENPKVLLAAVNQAEIYRFLCPPLDANHVLQILEGAWLTAQVIHIQEALWTAAREISSLPPSSSSRLEVSRDSLIASYFNEPETLRRRSDSLGDSMQKLSAREGEIVEKLASGQRVKEVAAELAISTHTVRNHLKAIYRKLNVRSQLDLLGLMSRKTRKK